MRRHSPGLVERATARSRGDEGITVEHVVWPVAATLDEDVTRSINVARGRVARREQLTANALTIVTATADLVDRMDDPDVARADAHALAVQVRTQLAVLTTVLNEIDGVS